ncbi:MAG: TIGR02679 family protein [Actinomycetota bacterium]
MTLARWVRDPGLVPVWTAARSRLERNGIQPRGVVVVSGLDRPQRHAVSGLLGTPVVRETVRVDLAVLDAVVRERAGASGLVDLLEQLGGPLRNRRGERSAAAAAREAPFDAARDWLAEHPEVAQGAWVEPWLAGVRRSGLLARQPDPGSASRLMRCALSVVEKLVAADRPSPAARTVLAARVVGDAHALDDGTVLSQLVLRALAAASGDEAPRTAAARRELWERYGVSADTVSSTCLVLGLRPLGDSGLARRLGWACDAGDPQHVTAWDLARGNLEVAPGTWVLVCENPRVLEAVAQERGGAVPVVCTSGMPGLVVLDVLARLGANGATLAYHGDFDWPGIAIANRLAAVAGCTPWRMAASDYLGAPGDGVPLEGRPVLPVWDAALGEAMEARGTAVHEEAVLDALLAQLPT